LLGSVHLAQSVALLQSCCAFSFRLQLKCGGWAAVLEPVPAVQTP